MNSGEGNDTNGHRVVDNSASSVAVFAFIAILLLVVLLYLARTNAIVSAVIGLLLLVAIFFTVRSVREMQRWNPIEVVFSEWPLPLGSSQTLAVTRSAKLAVPDGNVTIAGQLTCEEKVTYQVGTDTRTDTADVANLRTTGTGTLASRQLTGTLPLEIPLDRGAPTMDLNHNEITWRLELEVTTSQGKTKSINIVLPVIPTLARTVQNIQDAPPEQP